MLCVGKVIKKDILHANVVLMKVPTVLWKILVFLLVVLTKTNQRVGNFNKVLKSTLKVKKMKVPTLFLESPCPWGALIFFFHIEPFDIPEIKSKTLCKHSSNYKFKLGAICVNFQLNDQRSRRHNLQVTWQKINTSYALRFKHHQKILPSTMLQFLLDKRILVSTKYTE